MKAFRLLGVAMATLFCCVASYGQATISPKIIRGQNDVTVGPTSVTSATTIATISMTGAQGAGAYVSAVGSGNTIVCDETKDGTNWTSGTGVFWTAGTSPTASASVNATGQYGLAVQAGDTSIRLRVSSYGSGTVTALITATVLAYLPQQITLGSNQSVNLTQVGGASVALGQTTKSASLPVAIASDQVGTAGSPAANVLTIQGAASMTPVKVDPSGVTSPISAASLPLPTGAAQDSTLTGGSQQTKIVSGGNTATVDTTAPAGSEAGLTSRTIPRKSGAVVTTSTLAGNAVFTGSWNDGNTDGASYATVQVFADQASASNGFQVQGTNDTALSNFTVTIYQASVSASTAATVVVPLNYRYWRIKYTNGSSSQGTFEVAATVAQGMPVNQDASGNVGVNVQNTPAVTQSGGPWTNNLTQIGGTNVVTSLSGAFGIGGDTASGSADAGFPMKTGGAASTSEPTAVTNGQRVNAEYDDHGKGVNSPYATHQNWISGEGSATTTSATTFLPAAGSGTRNYITFLHLWNSSGTAITITLSGVATATGTLTFGIPAGGGGNMPLLTPIVGTANTAIQFTCSSGVSTVYVNAMGFTGS